VFATCSSVGLLCHAPAAVAIAALDGTPSATGPSVLPGKVAVASFFFREHRAAELSARRKVGEATDNTLMDLDEPLSF